MHLCKHMSFACVIRMSFVEIVIYVWLPPSCGLTVTFNGSGSVAKDGSF